MATHRCSHGFTTAKARQDWMRSKGIAASDPTVSESLTADIDTSTPLFFWQIHSLLGWKKIENMVQSFYNRVYNDYETPWFRNAFANIFTKEHHVATQAAFWVDAFGGGRQYHGGDGRLKFHHTHNAHSVMNAAGATRWMYHMRLTLNKDVDWSREDPRIKACIVDFLKVRMMKYSEDHSWHFNHSDFDIGPRYNQIVVDTPVMVRGLVAAAEHNGKAGKIGVNYNRDKQRYDVVLGGGDSGGDDDHNNNDNKGKNKNKNKTPVVLSCKADNLLQLVRGVEVINLDTDTKLNGRKGIVQNFDDDTDQYQLRRVTSGVINIDPHNVVLPIKTRVKIVGLTSETAIKHNNTWAQIVDFDCESGRYLVQIDDKGSRLKLKLGNVRL